MSDKLYTIPIMDENNKIIGYTDRNGNLISVDDLRKKANKETTEKVNKIAKQVIALLNPKTKPTRRKVTPTRKVTNTSTPRSIQVSGAVAPSAINDVGENVYTLANRGRLGPGANWTMGRDLILNNNNLGFLTALGINEDSSVRDIQSAMLKYANNVGLNINGINNSNFVDDKWGTQTQSAWNTLLNYYNNISSRDSSSIPKPIEKAPDYGYRTDNTYENHNDFVDLLLSLGIRSNADLINWMHKTGKENYDWGDNNWAKQFRSDVDRVLNSDYSDQNIRKTLNTQGRWGRNFLGYGDFNDFQNVMATNAGTWNGNYDRNKEQAEKTINNSTPYSNTSFIDSFQEWSRKNPTVLKYSTPKYFKIGGKINK